MAAASLRTVGLGDDGEEAVRGSQQAFERRNRKGRGSQKDQVHEGSSFDGFSLVALPFALEDLTLDFAHAIPHQQPIQVIDFMLKSPRQIAATFQRHFLLIQRPATHLDSLGTRDLGADAGNAQAALFFDHASCCRDDLGVGEHDQRIRLFPHRDIDHEQPQRYANLRGGEADAGLGIHGFNHIIYELTQAAIERLHWRSFFAQHRIWVFTNRSDCHGLSPFQRGSRRIIPWRRPTALRRTPLTPVTPALRPAADPSVPKAMLKCNADAVCTRALTAAFECNREPTQRMGEVAKLVRKEYNHPSRPREASPCLRGGCCSPSGASTSTHVRFAKQEGARMRHTLIGKNLEVTPELRAYFESKVEKLDRLIPTSSDELVSLQATVEKHLKRSDYSTSLSLHFPQHTLHSEEQSRDLKGAIRAAFDELIRQVDRFKSKLRGEHRWPAARNDLNP